MPRKLKCECGRCHTCRNRARARKTAAKHKARIDGTAGEIARLRAALEPFAKALDEAKHRGFHEWAAISFVTTDDFRRAAAALSGEVA